MFLPVAIMRAGNLNEPDTFWAVRAGQLIWAQHALPTSDALSWTAFGHQWTLSSWIFDLLLAGANALGGMAGIAIMCAAFAALLAALLVYLARRIGSRPWLPGILLILVVPLYFPRISAAPQLMDFLAASLLILLLKRMQVTDEPALVMGWLFLLMLVWANLHSSAVLGVAIVFIFAVVGLVLSNDHFRQFAAWVAVPVSALAVLFNPYGAALYTHFSYVAPASSAFVAEWQPLNFADPASLVSLLIGCTGLVLAVRRNDMAFISALAATIIASLLVVRLLPLAVLLAVPVIAAAISYGRVFEFMRRHHVVFVPPAIAALLALWVVAVPQLSHPGQPDGASFPRELVATVPVGCPLYNTDIIGSYVTLARPDVRVSLDTRLSVYGETLVRKAVHGLDGLLPLANAVTYARCALVPVDSGLAKSLAASPAWQLTGRQGDYVLFRLS